MSDVVVIRPGCTDFDEQHRIQGTLDLPLNERGQQQVAALVEQLRALPLEAIYTSDCEPARSTAEALGRELGLEVRELEGLRNLDQGLWQGLQIEDVRRKYPKVFKQWQESPERICPPGGEMANEALERIKKALHRPLKKKGLIGIVAPEPLATFIGCAIQGTRPVIPDLLAEPAGKSPSVAVLTTSVSPATPPGEIPVVAETNGSARRGAGGAEQAKGLQSVEQGKGP